MPNKELSDRLSRPGVSTDIPDRRVIGGGSRAVVFVWLTVDDPSSIPTSLRHRLIFKAPDSEKELTLEAAQVSVRRERPIVIGHPLGESMWIAARGPSNVSGHRRALIPTEGSAYIAQRFAVDLMKVGMDRRVMPEDHRSTNQSWYGYGAEVIAVADSVVADVRDGIPDNVPLSPERAVPITSETVGGNYVMPRLAAGWYAFYAPICSRAACVSNPAIEFGRGRYWDGSATPGTRMLRTCTSTSRPPLPRSEQRACRSRSSLSRCWGSRLSIRRRSLRAIKRALEMPLENELIRFR